MFSLNYKIRYAHYRKLQKKTEKHKGENEKSFITSMLIDTLVHLFHTLLNSLQKQDLVVHKVIFKYFLG